MAYDQNRGMFGYEGEGYMNRGRGRGYDRPSGERPRGYSDLESDRGYGHSSGSDYGPRERQSFRGRGPKNYQRSDERIREDVCERLTFDEDVDATEIEVSVSGSTVTLSGTVHDRYEKRRAEDIAESVTGVKDVQNQIRVNRESQNY